MKYYHLTGIVLFILTEIIKIFFSNVPHWVEKIYSQHIYVGIRFILEPLTYILPLPGVIFIPFLAILYLLYIWYTQKSWKFKILGTLNFLGVLYFIFYLVWGFNYYRLPIDAHWKIKSMAFNKYQLENEFRETTLLLLNARKQLADTSQKVNYIKYEISKNQQHKIYRENLQNWLKTNDVSFNTSVAIKTNIPKGFFLHFSTAGMYFPFSGEGNVDPGLHPLQFSSVLAHEMAHGYGFADEGTCNFLAFICHFKDKNDWIAYTSILGYWRYLASNLRRISPAYFDQKWKDIPTGIKLDLKEISEFNDRYPDLIPNLQYKIYDAYLKGQGIQEGMLNYNKVIGLVLAYKAANPFIFEDSSAPK